MENRFLVRFFICANNFACWDKSEIFNECLNIKRNEKIQNVAKNQNP
jgi:hypothetical protein